MGSIARRSPGARVAKFEFDQPMGPKKPRSSGLSQTDEAIILVFRYGTRLSLDDCLERLRRQMPKLSRSRLYGCLKRHGLSRIGRTAMTPLSTASALKGPYSFEISAHEVVFRGQVLARISHTAGFEGWSLPRDDPAIALARARGAKGVLATIGGVRLLPLRICGPSERLCGLCAVWFVSAPPRRAGRGRS